MAKKIVRGITDVKTINNQDFDTNNVNDLLSDGQYNYIHRKKGKSEEYHNLTDNIKTISSDNTDLLTVTNNNKTTNSATLSPKHDAQKEQVLESERATITIKHGTNGTTEKTKVDTNPQKVLEHENLISDSEYITLDHETDVNKTHIKTESLKQELQQLHETKQDTLVAGDGITIQGQTISASGGGGSVVKILENNQYLTAIEHIETCGNKTIKTFSFEISAFGTPTISGELRTEIVPFIPLNSKIISGGLQLWKDDDTHVFIGNIKNGSENDRQHATFTFVTINEDGGGDGGGGAIIE